ncbi:MAG: DUF1810 family protein [Oscillospiraceae bacterium]|nr:DUF1810 family protein [Oscillospiraceae bacterium]
MLHEMKLERKHFEAIRNGTKTDEIRLHDDKRKQVQPGDFIAFSVNGDPTQKIQTEVIALHPYPDFAALFAALPAKSLGFGDAAPDPACMYDYYAKEAEAEFGVLGIEIRMTGLQRYLDAQDHGFADCSDFQAALSEIRCGRKKTHWMWYVFPQLAGLAVQPGDISRMFELRGRAEAALYIRHPVLRSRLTEISRALMDLDANDPVSVFGTVDAYKLRSCMTLFAVLAPEEPVFAAVLGKFCMGTQDELTLRMLR